MTAPHRAQPLRSAVAGALLLGVALTAHVAAGGALPSPAVLALLGASLATVGAVVTRAARRRRTVLALVGASQYAAHQVLAVTAHWSLAAGELVADACGGVHAHAVVDGCAGVPAAGDVVLHGSVPWVDARMAALHLLGTVAAGLALRQGDRLRAALTAALRPLWRTVAVVTHPVRPVLPGAGPVDVPVVVPQAAVRVTRRRRRGPPPRAAVTRARVLAPALPA